MDDVIDEVGYAVKKHGIEKTALRVGYKDAYIILAEEVGEVARALTYDEGDESNLYAELIQVAAVSVAFATQVREAGQPTMKGRSVDSVIMDEIQDFAIGCEVTLTQSTTGDQSAQVRVEEATHPLSREGWKITFEVDG
jgi:NTP pyrophosphatase (non-canonical NTP hydrolase)